MSSHRNFVVPPKPPANMALVSILIAIPIVILFVWCRCQYTSVTEWSGGMYISPGMAGSRSGALIATAWAAIVHLGNAGYLKATQETMATALQFKACIESVPELQICGEPAMCLIAFTSRSKKFDVWMVRSICLLNIQAIPFFTCVFKQDAAEKRVQYVDIMVSVAVFAGISLGSPRRLFI